MNFLSSEKLINVENISSQKVQCMRVIMLNRLWNINDINFILPVKHIVLTEICVNKSALLIQNSHYLNDFEINFWKFLYVSLNISQFRCWLHILTNKVHDQDIRLDGKTNWRWNFTLDSFEISKLFLGPFCHHFSWIGSAVSSSESELSANISISIFKN